MRRCLINQNKMPVERVANLEKEFCNKIKEEVQVPNETRVIN